jgi:hypothetical protein
VRLARAPGQATAAQGRGGAKRPLEKIGFSGLAIPLEKGRGRRERRGNDGASMPACMRQLPLLGAQLCNPAAVQRNTSSKPWVRENDELDN